MPNWCHNKLSVEGPTPAVDAFIKKVAIEVEGSPQPLSFRAHVPEPSADVYAAMEEAAKRTCDLCGGNGIRPATREEAEARSLAFHESYSETFMKRDGVLLELDDRPKCNGCKGTGLMVPYGAGWYDWRLENWGTKWDAAFDGPFIALGAEGADVKATVEAQGRFVVPTNGRKTVLYNFDTAWSPPQAWLARSAELEPELSFTLRYAEAGNDLAGEIVAVDGEVTVDRELKVDDVLSSEEMWF